MDAVKIIAIFAGVILYLLLILFYCATIFASRAIMIFSYVMQSLGLSAMAKNRGIERPWLAWVPMASTWMLGRISDQYREKATGEDPNLRKKLLIQKIIKTAIELSIIGALLLWYFGMIAVVASAQVYGLDVEALIGPMVIAMYVVLLIWYVAMMVIMTFYYISQYKALFDIYRSSDPKTSTMFFVLSFFSQIALTLGIGLNRNKTLGMPPEPAEIAEE